MVIESHGNLLQANADALVNTVNTVGVMGKGIALQFKQAYPHNFDVYRRACERGEFKPGRMLVVETGQLQPRYIINFPTKRHWRGKARLADIDAGLPALVAAVRKYEIRSIAVPPLGCGNGGLRWSDVRPRIERAFADVPDVQVFLYPPEGTPAAATMPVATTPPRMTTARAILIHAARAYRALEFDLKLTLLEMQKLAYFLQAAGEGSLRLKFVAGTYGPYAENLYHALLRMEGHFIRGLGAGSRSPDVEITILSEALPIAAEALRVNGEAHARADRVVSLIEGFETPFGMELLATVHWVARQEPEAKTDLELAVAEVQRWSTRKKSLLRQHHITAAWRRLREQGWLN